MGSSTSPLRTPDQTLLAEFWQSTTPNYIFNRLALQLASERRMTFSEKARRLGLLNAAMADADIVVLGCELSFCVLAACDGDRACGHG